MARTTASSTAEIQNRDQKSPMTVDHLEINREYVSQFTDNALIAVIVYAICEKAKREKKTIREEIAHCVSRMEEEYTRLGLIDQVPPWGKG